MYRTGFGSIHWNEYSMMTSSLSQSHCIFNRLKQNDVTHQNTYVLKYYTQNCDHFKLQNST